jgi:molybdopterin-guanine dinucleotide biosynthesis protein A
MGADKGSLVYGNSALPQVESALESLRQVCGNAWVSVNEEQLEDPLYAQLPTIVDTRKDQGPAAGLLSAFEFNPDTAWLVLAVDMPRVSPGLLHNLVAQRDTSRIATVHCHADGTIEPLCAIWEAHSRDLVIQELESGRGSLRVLAQEQHAAIARLPAPEQLRNVNTPDERSAMQQRLADTSDESSGGGRDGA